MSTGSPPSTSLTQSSAAPTSITATTLMPTSQATRSTDCRKFSPNIFNKSKCSHCFRQREEHSAAALECNRASRKISKCGYLFVAPDWDFSNPLYRTKRWQRRWFVLYDDGELTYSVDEHPETVPQACIDMTKVLEVSTGEEVTGHKNSMAITAPDRVTFVKGTCPEECKWWHNILVAFPKAKGRHKRNATFPGGQPKTLLQSNSDTGTALPTRTRHNSYHKDAITSDNSKSILISRALGDDKTDRICKVAWQRRIFAINTEDNKDDDIVEAATEDENDVDINQRANSPKRISAYDQKSQNDGNETTSRVSPPRLIIEKIRSDEKTIKDIANTITNLSQQQKCRWSTSAVSSVLNCHMHHAASGGDGNVSRDEIDFHRTQVPVSQLQPQTSKPQLQPTVLTTTVVNVRPKSLALAANSSPAIVSAVVKKIPPAIGLSANPGYLASDSATAHTPQHSNMTANSGQCNSSPRFQLQLKHLQQKHHSNQHRQQQHIQQAHERGDPDGGCNLDDLSASYLSKTAELRVGPNTEEAHNANAKKGWLMKQDNCTGDWTKHWFILSGSALLYYRDPVAEERGVLDGVLDVNSLVNVGETNTSRTYAFQVSTWDQLHLTLACLSPKSRNSWMAALKSAAGLKPKALNTNGSTTFASATNTIPILDPTIEAAVSKKACSKDDDVKSQIEKDFIKAQRNHETNFQNFQESTKSNNSQSKMSQVDMDDASPKVVVTATSGNPKASFISQTTQLTPKSAHFSSDEEYRTASEGGRRDSVEGSSPLSPSSPMSLTLTRAKDRLWARSTNYQRLQKRSRSSPPSSRHSTVDSVGSDELSAIHPVKEEMCIDKELQLLLGVAEKERNILRDAAKDGEARMAELLDTLERTEQQLNARVSEMEEIRESLTAQLDDVKQNADDIVNKLTNELDENKKKVKRLEVRLAQGIDENEILDKRLRELEGCSPSSFGNLHRSKFKRMDSLRDLTQITILDPYCLDRDTLAEEYNELKSRFEKAVNEIRAMKRELKDSQNQFDTLEIKHASLKQDFEGRQNEDRAQLQMMAERIQDLTLKYSSSERQVRTLKQKLAKVERRRSLSLKGKEQLPLPRDFDGKTAMESTIDKVEKSSLEDKLSGQMCTETLRQPRKASRRRSLESSANVDNMEFMVRVTDLEKRYEGGSSTGMPSTFSTLSIPAADSMTNADADNVYASTSSKKLPDHLVERLRCLENVLITSKDRLEQSLHQFQNLRSSRTRRSVSPIADRKDSYRYIERCVADVVKLIRESCETCIIRGTRSTSNSLILPESNPVKLALIQLEGELRSKLGDLLQQRRVLRERNELTNRKGMELLAERIAFESVCFGRLRESLARAEHPELLAERQSRAEVAETSHLMAMLKTKLRGKCALKPTGSVDILAGVLARRLVLSTYRGDSAKKPAIEPVDKNILDDLLRQQNELNVISRRYKNNAMESLAFGLAVETISYTLLSSNDLVQGAIQEAWRQAQETVNAELVQSEIAHIMMRNAERFENAITPSFGYTLSTEERLSFEKFADAVYDVLRKEMESVVTQLTSCYEDAIHKVKRDQWRLNVEQERKASENRQLLSEFADIVAHKALIDARISVLRGDLAPETPHCDTWDSAGGHLGVTALQKYEDLFEELSKDLQINNPNDILAEADFQFMYNQYSGDFLNNRQVLSDISTFLGQLEDSLFALKCEATSATSISRSDISIENLQDVCRKCSDLRQCADQLLQVVHRKLNAPCQICLQVREKLCNLQQQHETEILQVQQSNNHDMKVLMKELNNQRHELQSLEEAKRSFSEDLQRNEELIEKREFEVDTMNKMLRLKQRDQHELLAQLDEQTEKLRLFQDESEALTLKCARQDEEYAVLLQERDCIQSALANEKERSRRFENRLELLELEHGKQLECLQEAYRDQLLSHCSDFSNAKDEESFRQRYQAEIEQLRTLCEKGLSAMKLSHRRVIGDMEEKHRQEIARLLIEKDNALAEETQATLAALDAMRKAHQNEVQREIANFKKEFLKQFHRGKNTTDTKAEELEELRQEILLFSEKYSIKCVEHAALEEKLRSANQKLKSVQQMQQIELRNKQFRAHLSSDNPTTDANFVQGLTTSSEDAACRDSEV